MSSQRELAVRADGELNPVRGGRRLQHGGFYDTAHSAPSIPTSRDPALVEAYLERQRQLALPGIWRSSSNPKNYRNIGTQRDIDYAIMEW